MFRPVIFIFIASDQQSWVLHSATMVTLLPAMTTQKSLTNAFVAMAVEKAQASLQAQWCFIAMMRDRNWLNQVYHKRFGAFTIVKDCGLVAHCSKGLIIALHSLHDQLSLWQETHYRYHLAWCTQANCPCSEGLIVVPSPVAILPLKTKKSSGDIKCFYRYIIL